MARPRTTCSRCFSSSSAVSAFGLIASSAWAASSNCGGPILCASASDSAKGYLAWGGPPLDPAIDGTIVPSAAGGSLMFTPELSVRTLRTMREKYGEKSYGRYGFVDAFIVALVQLEPLMSVAPGSGVVFFMAVVVLTMLAALSCVVSAYWAAGGTALLSTVGGELERLGRAGGGGVVLVLVMMALAKAVGAVVAVALVHPPRRPPASCSGSTA